MDKASPHLPEGTDDWFVAHLVAVQSRLYRYIATLVFNRTDVEDLCQKTCLTAWQERQRFEKSRDFYAWVCGIARNHIQHYCRSLQRTRVVLDSELVDQLAERLAQEDAYFERRHEALSHCLDKLPERERQLITGYYSQTQTVKSLAATMGLPVQGLYKRLQRIRAALRNCIDAAVAWESGT